MKNITSSNKGSYLENYQGERGLGLKTRFKQLETVGLSINDLICSALCCPIMLYVGMLGPQNQRSILIM